ncbi:MAG: hypothetical protein AB7G11_11075 [Phycisphaerales bacterium]
MTTWDQATAEFACEHETAALVCYAKSNGSQEYRRQCQRCGQTVEVVKKASLTEAQRNAAPPYDHVLVRTWWQNKDKRNKELREERRDLERSQWWSRYTFYLESSQWRDKRNRVLERDGNLCQACRRRPATQAHHLTYAHVFREPLFDLIAVCDVCHKALHEPNSDIPEPSSP